VDWWALELITLVAGLLPDADTAVGACGVLFAINVVCFFCVSAPAGIRIRASV
jgi:hypothetical protein